MALVVETGAIVTGANAYVTLAEFKAYIGTIPLPAATDPAYENAIINATRYLDGKYRQRWQGFRVQPTIQPLEWPRLFVPFAGAAPGYAPGLAYASYLPSNAIPQRLKDATCEAALRALSGPLAIDADTSVASKKIDVLETTYRPGAIPKQLTYQVIDQLLSDYLKPLGSCDAVRG